MEIALPEDSGKASLAQAGLKYAEEQGGWIGRWPYGGYEVGLWIEGGEDAPYARFIELAEAILPKLEEIESASNAYLRSFIGGGADGFYQGAWKISALRLRQEPGSRRTFGSEFEARLSIGGDDYGLWSVGFAFHTTPSRVLSPYFFSRRQW